MFIRAYSVTKQRGWSVVLPERYVAR